MGRGHVHSSLSSGSGLESTVLSGFACLGDTQREPALSGEPLRRLATELREGGPAGASPEENTLIQAWCHMLNISAVGRWRQEDQAFYFILGYVMSLRPAWST